MKAEERELDNVEFLVSDMRHPLDQQFDAILNLFTSFGYFKSDSENREVFGSVNEMLPSDGIFFMDYMNADWVYNNFRPEEDRKSTRLNSSHVAISYAVFCLKKKNKQTRRGLGRQTE